MISKKGIKEQIKSAKTILEAETLLATARSYKNMSYSTANKCEKAFFVRVAELRAKQ